LDLTYSLNLIMNKIQSIHTATVTECDHLTEEDNHWLLEDHQHEELELIYLFTGKASINNSIEIWDLHPNDLIVNPPNIQHSMNVNLSHNQEIMRMLIKIDINSIGTDRAFCLHDQKGLMTWPIKEIIRFHKYSDNSKNNRVIIEYLVKIVFFYLVELIENQSLSQEDRIGFIINYLRHNFMKNQNIDELSYMVNMSPCYFRKKFKNRTNCSPVQLITKFRIEMAKKLLISSNSTIVEIANKVGIEDEKYFSRIFKKIQGYSPSEFRNKSKLSVS